MALHRLDGGAKSAEVEPFDVAIPHFPAQLQALVVVGDRFVEALLLTKGVAQAVEGLGLAVPVPGLPADRQASLQADDRVLEAPLLTVGVPQVVEGPP